ncbi:MAG: S41 family peptidase [Candidatus Aminicenantes bacterium]|nr:S41 family peptidase [Candidatus Aminicenantes bacterium]
MTLRDFMKNKAFFPLLAAVLFLGPAAPAGDPWSDGLAKIDALEGLIRAQYVRPVEADDLARAAVKGMLDTLDPHSYLLDPEALSRMSEEQRGAYFGLGIQIQKQLDRLVVISPVEGGPAWRLGVQAGDVISQIEGESTVNISANEAVSKLRGPKGSMVTITLARDGLEKPFDLTITREEIPLYSVPYAFLLDAETGYVFIRYFAETTTEELENKLEALAGQGMKKLILDLRGNAGGPLLQAIGVADQFLPRGAAIVSVRGRNSIFDRRFPAVRDNAYEKTPLIVLISQGSASASEIVAGAVMDHDRGLVIGEDSWGKSLVQQMFPLSSDTAMALTIARYYTPSGRSLQRDYSHLDDYFLDANKIPESDREVNYTAKGRKVLGQGGITPDLKVEFNLLLTTAELRVRGAFFAYARKFASHQTALGRKFVFPNEPAADKPGPGTIRIGNSFIADAAVLEDFRAYLASAGIKVEAKQFDEAAFEIRREIEREVVSLLWGVEEGWRAFEKNDPVIRKALEAMAEAARMIQ